MFFRRMSLPFWRSAKYEIIWGFLLDMKLIKYSGDILMLTKDGAGLSRVKSGVYE
jgi:hypothetical protein